MYIRKHRYAPLSIEVGLNNTKLNGLTALSEGVKNV